MRTFRRLGAAAMALRAIQRPFASPGSCTFLPAYRHSALFALRRDVYLIRNSWEEYHSQIEDAHPPDIFRQWKGEQLTWPEWLSMPAADGGPSREEMGYMADWNITVMRQERRESAGQFEALSKGYIHDVETAVQDRRVSEHFLERVHRVAPHTQWLISGPLQPLDFSGRAFPEHNTILLHPQCSTHTVYHENTHLMGGFKSRLFNEVVDDLITDELCSPDRYKKAYTPAKLALQEVFRAGGITTYELSELFAQNGGHRDDSPLKELLSRRVAPGIYDDLESSYKKSNRYYRRRFAGSESYYYAGLDLMRLVDPSLSYAQAMHRAHPALPDEYTHKKASWLESLHQHSYWRFALANYAIAKTELQEYSQRLSGQAEIQEPAKG